MFSKRGNQSSLLGASNGTWRAYPQAQSFGADFDDGTRLQMMAKEIANLKQENVKLQSALYEMQTERDKWRTNIRKMKVENGRLKLKLKRVGEAAKNSSDLKELEELTESVDFSEVKDFLLIGGVKDPLDVQYESQVKDAQGLTHKTGERYLWFKMAENFNDHESAKLLLTTEDQTKAQEIVNNVKNFDQAAWDAIKLKHYEEYQRLKFEQNRALRCLLLKTAPLYLAIASQDKTYGTGWRKQRLEADKPQMWDGENMGGKILMKLRDEFSAHHSWVSDAEQKEAQKSFEDHKRTTWRRSSTAPAGGRRGGPGTGRGAGTGRRGVGGRRGARGSSAAAPYGDMSAAASFFDGYTSFSASATPMPLMGYSGSFGGRPFKRRR